MSRRTDSIRSMFSVSPTDTLSADNKPVALPRVSSGSVRSLRDTFSDVEKENEELRERIASSEVAIALDPSLIDPSPLADRFIEQEAAAFEALKSSIRDQGQEIPVLVREHPDVAGRYQCAYGHRRVRAARELGILVKAYVRPLTFQDLVIAQGIENSAREDLSFIERAVFAVRLEDAGFERAVTQTALSVDRSEVSKLVTVARAIPGDLIEAIGRAPRVGRGRWQALAEALRVGDHLRLAHEAIKDPSFRDQTTDMRFLIVLSAANKLAAALGPRPLSKSISSTSGTEIAKALFSVAYVKLTVSRAANEGFAAYLLEKLPELFEAYAASDVEESRN